MEYKELEKIAKECGFTHTAPLAVTTMQMKQEVRDMCAQNTCGQYGKNWCCPPGCGDLEVCQQTVNQCKDGILVQTVGELEDEMDGEGMMEAQEEHSKHFLAMVDRLHELGVPMLPLGAGTCTRCKVCTYPDAPCRFPEKKISSMEAYGMLVLQACKENHLEYYYGPNAIAYTGCFLLK